MKKIVSCTINTLIRYEPASVIKEHKQFSWFLRSCWFCVLIYQLVSTQNAEKVHDCLLVAHQNCLMNYPWCGVYKLFNYTVWPLTTIFFEAKSVQKAIDYYNRKCRITGFSKGYSCVSVIFWYTISLNVDLINWQECRRNWVKLVLAEGGGHIVVFPSQEMCLTFSNLQSVSHTLILSFTPAAASPWCDNSVVFIYPSLF